LFCTGVRFFLFADAPVQNHPENLVRVQDFFVPVQDTIFWKNELCSINFCKLKTIGKHNQILPRSNQTILTIFLTTFKIKRERPCASTFTKIIYVEVLEENKIGRQ
jgi:hypothetical protein